MVNGSTLLRPLQDALRSSLLRTAGVYGLANALERAIPFLLLPVLTRYLSPADYGLVAMFLLLANLTAPFAGLSIYGAVSRQFFDLQRAAFSQYVANALFTFVVATLLTGLALWTFSGPICRLANIPADWLWAVLALVAGGAIIRVWLAICQVQKKPLHYAAFQLLQTLLTIGVSLSLIIGWGMDWRGRIGAQLAATAVFTVAALVLLWKGRWLAFRYDASHVKQTLSFGVPLIPHALSGVLLAAVDRLFIVHWVGMAEAGVYTIGCQLALLVSLAGTAFHLAWMPWLYAQLKSGKPASRQRVVQATYAYDGGMLLLVLLVSCVSPWFLTRFISQEFQGAQQYIVWISLGYAFCNMKKMVGGYIFFVKKTHILAGLTCFAATANVALNYVLVPLNGALGAAQATAASFLLTFLLTWALAARVCPMPWSRWHRTAIDAAGPSGEDAPPSGLRQSSAHG